MRKSKVIRCCTSEEYDELWLNSDMGGEVKALVYTGGKHGEMFSIFVEKYRYVARHWSEDVGENCSFVRAMWFWITFVKN